MKKRIISIFLALITVVQCITPVFAESNPYICTTYEECTRDGNLLCIVVDDETPIRRKPEKKGELVTTLEKNQFVSVSEIVKNRYGNAWARLATDTGEDLYIFADHLVGHYEHVFNTVSNGSSTVKFCTVCCFMEVTNNEKAKSCNLGCRFQRLIRGDFGEDRDFIDLLGTVLVGLLPFLGQAADARDLAAAINNNDPVGVLLGAVALLPGCGDLIKATRYVDVSALKTVDKAADAAKTSKKLFKHGGSLLGDTAKDTRKAVDVIWDTIDNYPSIKGVDGKDIYIIGGKGYYGHAVDEFLTPEMAVIYGRTNFDSTLRGHSRGVPPAYVNSLIDEVNELGIDLNNLPTQGITIRGITVKPAKSNEKFGLDRINIMTGSLKVVMEKSGVVTPDAFDTVVTIITH